MPLPTYPVHCYQRGCNQEAIFKIAARWSDGVTQELKTYSLSCQDCLSSLLQDACARHTACRLAPGELLEAPGVYELNRGTRDRQLSRRLDLERSLMATDVTRSIPLPGLAEEVDDASPLPPSENAVEESP